MEFKREDSLKIRFVIPDRPTVRQQMAYFSEATGTNSTTHLERLWLGARTLIQEWECDLFKHDVDLDDVNDPQITDAMLWVAVQVRGYLNKLNELPKN